MAGSYDKAKVCLERRERQLARVRVRVIKISSELVAMRGLLEHNKRGFCELAQENIQLMEENEAMSRLLKVGK